MDYAKAASEVLRNIGGKENLVSAAHCATRLRLVIADNSKSSKAAIENIDGVKGVFEASGQLQIIFGTGTVNKVFDEFIKLSGVEAGTKEDVKKAAAAQTNIFKRAIKTLGDVFVPIIPAIVASGLLMGLMEGVGNAFGDKVTSSSIYTMLSLFANAAFTFLPILIAISAAKAFGANVYLGAVIGMIMIHPNLINAWSVASMTESGEAIPTFSIFGLYNVNQVGYQGHVIPVVIAVFLLSVIEKKLHKIVPEMIDLFVTPLVSVLITGFATLAIIGPIFGQVETWVLDGVQYLVTLPYGLGALLVGAVYAVTVVAGLHHMYNAIEAGMISTTGMNIWMPIASAANVAQGAAALAVAFRSKNRKTKAMAFPASLSAFLGITEPAIFGVNVRYGRPFIAGLIGGAVGAMVSSIMGVYATAYGITGLFGFLITRDTIFGYLCTLVVASAVSFVISFALGIKEEPEAAEVTDAVDASADHPAIPQAAGQQAESVEIRIPAPIRGKVIPISEAPDETFASGALGQGMAIEPEEGIVRAPFDGTVAMLFDTKHAIALADRQGAEILIHIGLDTVGLGGAPFTYLVEDGQEIHEGQEIMKFDISQIQQAGLKTVTPMVVTNSDDFASIELQGDALILKK